MDFTILLNASPFTFPPLAGGIEGGGTSTSASVRATLASLGQDKPKDQRPSGEMIITGAFASCRPAGRTAVRPYEGNLDLGQARRGWWRSGSG